MVKKFQAQQGYSLVSVLLIFTLIGIIGLSLTAYTMNSLKGVVKNKESIENKVNAENSIEMGLAYIDQEIENLNNGDLNENTALPLLQSALDHVAALGVNNGYTLERKIIKNSGVILEEVTIKSPIGQTGKFIKKKVTISTIAEVFQYSTVSPSDLVLNGAPYLEGDVLVNGNVYTRNQGKFIKYRLILPDRDYWVNTSYPAIKGNLTVSGGYYRYNQKQNSWVPFIPEPDNMNKYFSVVPKMLNRNLLTETILPKNLVDEKKKTEISQKNLKTYWLNDFGKVVGSTTINGSAEFLRLGILESGKLVINGDARINGNLRIDPEGELIVKGDLFVGGDLKIRTAQKLLREKSGGKLTVEGSIHVNGKGYLGSELIDLNKYTPDEVSKYGSLTLGSEDSFIYIDEKTEIKNFNFTGKMYIEDSVDINGDFNTNGTVYVTRQANIEDFSDKDGTAVIIADEEVTIANNNEFEDKPKVLNAYFYSNRQLEIFGIGSNLKIHGGVYGNPVVLNVTKGKTKDKPFANSFSVGPSLDKLYFQERQTSLAPTTSRLSIIYNKGMVLNPPIGIPTVDKFTMKELETIYEK